MSFLKLINGGVGIKVGRVDIFPKINKRGAPLIWDSRVSKVKNSILGSDKDVVTLSNALLTTVSTNDRKKYYIFFEQNYP